MDISKLFWASSVEDMSKGYIYDEISENYICLICGEKFTRGLIFNDGGVLMEAAMAASVHIDKVHGGVFEYLLSLDKKYTGLSEVQSKILEYFHKGYSDKEIVKLEGDGSESTIRNHRFKLREKEKQAKTFLALMTLLSKNDADDNDNKLVQIHRRATMVDERYTITEIEKENIIKNYIVNDKIVKIPRAEKKKIIILQYLLQKFQQNKRYTEKEVNEIIKSMHEDYAALRRYLIQYGFMDREDNGSAYWIND
ncbi:DUF2087 domain-containing protein [Clostridium estertheticum]|uniref:DUF2087 domain-containing protein n=1 Tax=Clostridium estertheticum TaxID=238834 RepID=UPI0013E98DED|nr:DUF2087 domain-containing protein [Clostridium estertheticum]MBZ9685147.1 DUF2087 domain-containing protein [Clostridium estertheticum]